MAKKEPKKPKGKAKTPPAPPTDDADDDAATRKRVAILRHKLTKAMDDPLMRDQIVKAIRSMMNEGR